MIVVGAVVGAGLMAGMSTLGRADEGDRFFTQIADLPVMPGLSEMVGAGVYFDKPGGRIAAAFADGKVERGAVLYYYGSALPQLGWTLAGKGIFRREGELLRLEFLGAADEKLTVRFALSPQ